MQKVLFFLCLLIFFTSCKKDPKNILISGTVKDPYQNIPVAGAKITLQANGVIQGIYNASFVTLGTITTDALGQFQFEVDESTYDSFRFVIVKDGYYTLQQTVTAATVNSDKPLKTNFDFLSVATILVHIKNISPFDDDDKLITYFQNNPISNFDCCSSSPITYLGMAIDTSFFCKSVGAFDLSLSKSILKNNVQTYETTTVHTLPNDTVEINVFY